MSASAIPQIVVDDFQNILEPFFDIGGWTQDPELRKLYEEIVLGKAPVPKDSPWWKSRGRDSDRGLIAAVVSVFLLITEMAIAQEFFGFGPHSLTFRAGLILWMSVWLFQTGIFVVLWRWLYPHRD